MVKIWFIAAVFRQAACYVLRGNMPLFFIECLQDAFGNYVVQYVLELGQVEASQVKHSFSIRGRCCMRSFQAHKTAVHDAV